MKVKISRAIISVSDKTGIIELARALSGFGVEILSTGGTMAEISNAGIPVTAISDVTGFPECLDGRVKTLHPAIHGGLLAIRKNPDHMNRIAELGIKPIDLVISNLYPFKETIAKPDVTYDEAIEQIDIGGPSMIRAAAKNWQDVSVVVDSADYTRIIDELEQFGEIRLETKRVLCYKAFEHTSQYDTIVAEYIRKRLPEDSGIDTEFPDHLTLTYDKVQSMRYGENPHQRAAFYREVRATPGCITDAVQLHGKELSYNNINDANGAIDLLREFDTTAVVAVKHATPCGVGIGDSIYEAYMKAYESDPVSIFGGIIATNAEIDVQTAEAMSKLFLEIIVAPAYTSEALDILRGKKNIRLLVLDTLYREYPEGTYEMRKVAGGLLVQNANDKLLPKPIRELKVVTKRQPTEKELDDLFFAWKLVKHTKSNGIAIAKDGQSLGIGPGQVNRIWPTEMAIARSGDKVIGAVLASDAYFPLPDCVEAAGKAGITAIIQPGGSIRDKDSIDMCDKYDIAMVFTEMRHFKH